MENQRIRLSKKLLKNALLELLRKLRIDKISIQRAMQRGADQPHHVL